MAFLETGRRVAGLLDAGAVKDISDEELSSFLQLLLLHLLEARGRKGSRPFAFLGRVSASTCPSALTVLWVLGTGIHIVGRTQHGSRFKRLGEHASPELSWHHVFLRHGFVLQTPLLPRRRGQLL